MADHNLVFSSEMSSCFTFNGTTWELNLGANITKDANNNLELTQANLQTIETVWSGSSTGFLTVTPAGTNGHAPTFTVDFTDAVFKEAVQDAIGEAILNDAGNSITYDDINDTISTTLGNLAFQSGTVLSAGVVTAVADPASTLDVSITAAGIQVNQNVSTDAGITNLAKLGADGRVMVDSADVKTELLSDIVCDSAGTQRFRVSPL